MYVIQTRERIINIIIKLIENKQMNVYYIETFENTKS